MDTATPATQDARQTDAEQMSRVARGDDRAFAALYAAHQPRVFRLAFGVLLSAEDARDVVQDVFVKLHAAAPRWEPRAQVSTWLHRVTLNAALAWQRRVRMMARAFRSPLPGVLPVAARTPEAHAHQAQASAALTLALRRLSPRERALVSLHLDAGLPPSRMAPLLDLSPNATRVALHRALDRVRQDLLRHGVTVDADPVDPLPDAPLEDA